MLECIDAVAAIAAVTIALTLSSLDRPTAALLGATGGVLGNFLLWLAVPHAWAQSLLLPWAAAAAGTVLLITGWSAVRAYSGLFEPPRADETDTGTLATIGGPARRSR